MVAKGSEKRRYQRLKDGNISLKVKAGDSDIITKSLDISASGVYCKLEKEIPLMSRIKVILVIPKIAQDQTEQKVKIETDGVVVREHPVIIDGEVDHYDAAIFFDNIAVRDKDAILNYINHKVKIHDSTGD